MPGLGQVQVSKFRLISYDKGISSLGWQDIPAIIVQFQVLLAIRDNFLYVFCGVHAPHIKSITHLCKLEFGAQVHAGIANGGWSQCKIFVKFVKHRHGAMMNTQNIINIDQNVRVYIPKLLVVSPLCTTDPGWQDRTCSQGVACNPPSDHGMLHQHSSSHRVCGQ
jgi:hypothetical protein